MKIKRVLCLMMVVYSLITNGFAGSKTIITEIPEDGLKITETGTYHFASDLEWKGKEGVKAAISIEAPNVTLDLKGHNLIGPRNVKNSGVIGIIVDGVDGFTLQKGTIKGFQMIGVSLANSEGSSLSKIVVRDIGNGVPGNTPSGLSASNCLDLALNNVSISKINGSWFNSTSSGQIVAGIFLSECSNVTVNGLVNDINGYASVVSGVFGILCNGVSMKKLTVDNVSGSAVAASGISFGLSKTINIEKCTVSNLHNDAGVCSGIATDDCQQIKVLNSTVNKLSTGLMPNKNAVGHTCIGMVFAPIRVVEGVSKITVTNPGSQYSQHLLPWVVIDPPQSTLGTRAVGFPIVNSSGELESVVVLNPGSQYIEAPNVEIVSNSLHPEGAGATATATFSAVEEGDASDINIERCKISNIVGSCDDAHGISLFVVSNATVRKVTVENVSDGRGGRGAKATGIEVYGMVNNLPSNILVENCKVKNISAISPGDLQAAGFSVAGKGVTFSNCTAENVTVSGVNPVDPTSPGYGIGFGWAPDIRPEYTYAAYEVKIEDCKALKCQVGFDTFYFQNSTWSNIRSVKNETDVKEESTETIRVLYCDKCSECPNAPEESPENWYTKVPVTNIATGNTVDKSKIK